MQRWRIVFFGWTLLLVISAICAVAACSDDPGAESSDAATATAHGTATSTSSGTATSNTSANDASTAQDADTTQKVAIPTFAPPEGTYAPGQVVTISCATPGASIMYSTDGQAPTTNYTSSLVLNESTVVKAIGTKSGTTSSDIATASYVVQNPAAVPSVDPASGNYTDSVQVTMSTVEANGAIYYTLDGSTPTTASAKYASPLTLTSTTTVSAISVAPSKTPSQIAKRTYTISATAIDPPYFSPLGGTFDNDVTVTIKSNSAGTTICYTTDGSSPTCNSNGCASPSQTYSSPIIVASSRNVIAIACKNRAASTSTSAVYTMRAAQPGANNATGTVTWGFVPLAQTTTTGATLLVTKTVDGSTPAEPSVSAPGTCTPASGTSASSTLPLDLSSSTLLGSLPSQGTGGLKQSAKYRIRACRVGYDLSFTTTLTYSVKLPQPSLWTDTARTRSAASGTYSSGLNVTIQSEIRGTPNADGAAAEGVICIAAGGSLPQCGSDLVSCATGTLVQSVLASSVVDPSGAGTPSPLAVWQGTTAAKTYNASEWSDSMLIACRPGTFPSDLISRLWSWKLNLAIYLGGPTGAPANPQLTAVAQGIDLASESLVPASPATPQQPGHVVFGLWTNGATVGASYTALNATDALLQTSAAMPTGIMVYYTEDGATPVLPATCGDMTYGPSTWKGESTSGHWNFAASWPQPSGGTPIKAIACATNMANSDVASLTVSTAP